MLALASACDSGFPECPDEPGSVCVWAGKTGQTGFNRDGHHRTESLLYFPTRVGFSPEGAPYILDWNNHAVRRVNEDGTLETVIGNGFVGEGTPDGSDLAPPGAPGTEIALNHPTQVVFAGDGTMLLAAWHNHRILTFEPGSGNAWVMCGLTPGFAGDGGPAHDARFNQPPSIALAPDGALYIIDQRNFRVRKVSAGAEPIVDTVVGIGEAGFAGDGESPLAAQLQFEAGGNPEPSGAVAVDAQGRLYIADSLNHRIRRVDFDEDVIETIAGTGEPGDNGDGGPALEAAINNPRDITLSHDGQLLYVADTENHRVRVIDLETGVIDAFAGTGVRGSAAEGLSRLEVELNRPYGVDLDPEGNVYISDLMNSRILRVVP